MIAAGENVLSFCKHKHFPTNHVFSVGLTHLITMDLHQKEIQGFFNIPVDNLRASPFLLQYIQEEVTALGYIHNTFVF